MGIADSTGLHTFTDDNLGRLLSLIGPVNPGPSPFPFISASFPLTFAHDANGNRILLQSWQGLQTYGYDARDVTQH